MNYNKIFLQIKKRPCFHGYISPNTETRFSQIHGLGLFAKKDIKKGEVVAVWGGCVVTNKEILKFSKNIGYNYALEIHPGFYLAEKKESELDSSDFINHSCLANSKIINKLTMITKRYVYKGEELTSDFSNSKNSGKKFVCNCGSKKCRKIVYFD
ncbi:MAG: SET domain-containing protein-lysine N-methyltransferase [bacterium]